MFLGDSGRMTGDPEVMQITRTSDTLGEERKLKSGHTIESCAVFDAHTIVSRHFSGFVSHLIMFCSPTLSTCPGASLPFVGHTIRSST
jgi:hypothetical protein